MSDNGLGVLAAIGGVVIGLGVLAKLLETIQQNQALERRVQVVENGLRGHQSGLLELRATQKAYITSVIARLDPIEQDVRDVRERVRVVETFGITAPLPPGHGFSRS
jgi:hypothetical protein